MAVKPLNKNDIIELEITGMTTQGSGVGRYKGMAVFVANSAAGDVLNVRIIKTAAKYAIGKIEEIIKPSEARIDVDCPAFKSCGGCVFRHISYQEELKIKEQRVKDAVERIGGIDDLPVNRIIGAGCSDHYRNKAQMPVGGSGDGNVTLGFFAYRSHRIVGCDSCLLQPAVFADVIRVFREWAWEYMPQPYNESTHKGKLRHLYIRYAQTSGDIMVGLVVNGNGLKGEKELAAMLSEKVRGFCGLIVNVNEEKTNVILGRKYRVVWGRDYILDELCGKQFRISPLSFYQVNHDQAERLYNIVKNYANLTGEETLLDLYCGTGTIGLTLAGSAKEVIGVEVVERAVEDARKNAGINKAYNARFLCADAAEAAAQLKNEGIHPDVMILDPPRKGCDGALIETAAQMAPERVVYVSCDPATLARDLKVFAEKGYLPVELTPVDMFPRTAHVECVCLLEKAR